MKKITLLLLFISYLSLSAQSYDFSISSGTYENLTNPTSLNNNQLWDDPEYAIPLGFNFVIGDYTFDTIYIVAWGTGGMLSPNQSEQGTFPILAPIAQDIEDRGYTTGSSQSPIAYQIDGEIGDRIVKIEWQNAGFWDDSTTNDFINFQVWLYENSNIIEYHYGPNSITNPSGSYEDVGGPIVLLYPSINWETDNFDETGYIVSGNPSDPQISEVNNDQTGFEGFLNGSIPDGIIYIFTPDELSTSDFKNESFTVYPNPSTGYINLHFANADIQEYQITIFNSNAQRIKSLPITGKIIDLSDLAAGVYFIELMSDSNKTTQKFIKL